MNTPWIANEIPEVRKLISGGICDVYILMTNAGVSAKQKAEIKASLNDAGVIAIASHLGVSSSAK